MWLLVFKTAEITLQSPSWPCRTWDHFSFQPVVNSAFPRTLEREEMTYSPFVNHWRHFLGSYSPFIFNAYFDAEWFLQILQEFLPLVFQIPTESMSQKPGSQEGIAYIEKASLLNHSCSPNSSWQMRDGVFEIWSCKKIKSGEELSISYMGQSEASVHERRQWLERLYGFVCSCERCEKEFVL